MWKRFKRLLEILKFYFSDGDNLFLYLLKAKAYDCLEDCTVLGVEATEELEDLIFHINSYLAVPHDLIETKYPEFKNLKVLDIIKKYKKHQTSIQEIKKYGDFLVDVEMQRHVERDFIFEHAKILPFGFTLR